MTRPSVLFKLIAALLTLQASAAFVTRPGAHPQPVNKAVAELEEASPMVSSLKPLVEKVGQFATTAAVVVSTSPLMALAEEADDYEYGAVNAPIGIAWLGGVVAILTALLPVALQSGEEAFDEMRERDAGKWGSGDSSALDKKRRR